MRKLDVDIDGDVGQVVTGNVIHEGAHQTSHLSSVVTISAMPPAAPVRTITELQRKRIAAKVKEVMQAARIERQLDVYSVVLTDFGVEKILDLPCDQFKNVLAMLDGWIAEEGGDPSAKQKTTEAPQQQCCSSCESLVLRVHGLQSRMRLVALSVAVAAPLSAYGVYASTTRTSPTSNVCQFDGKAHSIGSKVRMLDGGIYKCSSAGSSSPSAWAKG